MSVSTHDSMRRYSISFTLVLSLIAALTAIPAAFAQGNPVKFTSAVQVPNAGGFPFYDFGAFKAVGGNFNTDKWLDIVFSGFQQVDQGPTFFTNIAVNQGNGKFNVLRSDTGFGPDGTGPDLTADLNGDGITDVISWTGLFYVGFADSSTGLLIEFGKGDGTFINPTLIQVDAANSGVMDAVAADFDGNGSMDLAVLTSSNTLVILLNDGKGNFHSAFTYKAPASTTGFAAIAAGDINGDTLPDVVLVLNGTVTPYLSTHGGALIKGTTYSVPNAGTPVIADINHDGHADVAVPISSGIKFLLGSSGGQLTSGPTIAVPGFNQQIVFADFNKDGNMDLAVAGTQFLPGSVTSSYVNVYFGKGNDTFNSPSVYSTGNRPASLLAGDFFGTGNMDLVAFDDGDANLYLLRNPGNGYFQAAPVTRSIGATGIVAGDFNRNGKQDVAVVNTPNCKAPCGGSVTVLPGSGSTYFNAGKTYPIGMHGAAIAAGDLNKDGILDLVVVNATPRDAADTSVLLGKADGTFQPARNYKLGSLSSEIALVDMNKDGKLDLITDGGVALGKGDGTFSAIKPFPGGFTFAIGTHFAVGDVNGDGKLDVVVGATPDICSPEMQVLLGDGKGGFTLGNGIGTIDTLFETITSVALGRLRPGGPLDVVYSFAGDCGIAKGGEFITGANGFAGDGHGDFPNSFNVSSGGLTGDPFEVGPVVLADFNGDGKLDVGIGAFGHFVVSRGNGDDIFQPQQVFAAAIDGVSGRIAIADFDRDGRPDVMLTSGLGVTRLYNVTPRPK